MKENELISLSLWKRMKQIPLYKVSFHFVIPTYREVFDYFGIEKPNDNSDDWYNEAEIRISKKL